MGEVFDRVYYEEQRPSSGIAKAVDEARDRFIAARIHDHFPGGTLLDVGCGVGKFLERMAGSFSVSGLEISEAGLSQARLAVPEGSFLAGDIEREIPTRDSFDVVTAINVIEHLSDPVAGMKNIAKVQLGGGILVVHLPTIGNRVQRRLYEKSYASDPTHIFRPSGPEVIRLLRETGYEPVLSAYAPFTPNAVMSKAPIHPAFLALAVRT